jgi:hypothetical protein
MLQFKCTGECLNECGDDPGIHEGKEKPCSFYVKTMLRRRVTSKFNVALNEVLEKLWTESDGTLDYNNDEHVDMITKGVVKQLSKKPRATKSKINPKE